MKTRTQKKDLRILLRLKKAKDHAQTNWLELDNNTFDEYYNETFKSE